MANSPGEWGEAGMMVMHILKEHTELLTKIREDQVNNKVEIGVIKTKLAMIGALSGAVSGSITAIVVAVVSAMRG